MQPRLFKLALELGAKSVSALTDRVTHLIAENHGGAKYQCALERKIPILLPSWITESHRIWRHGDDVDLAQSIAAHRLPPFSGITLCISGISDIVRRTNINMALTAGGGTYVRDLVRPVRVTHLLCSPEAGVETDKMRYADKFNRAGEASPLIQIVWEEWFWDSLQAGGQMDESRYQARLPPSGFSFHSRLHSASHSATPSNLSLNDSGLGIISNSHDEIDSRRPFKNVVLCATGVLNKHELFKLALELGAKCVRPLTDRVTHLITDSNYGGEKYECALERGIPILLPSWITECHRLWQRGEPFDLAQCALLANLFTMIESEVLKVSCVRPCNPFPGTLSSIRKLVQLS
ncbi:hypothetical protein B0H16DRAFT_1799028 [Mycena metata]|uniref:BRCT domain-containing protein n=1 Tax=Mycena metata TaxID=1033252 RepID=A0AAD7MHJ1_9AGAR|nr:hypothetical protein B0H16DRAFT_1799028 [Mycena metata]